MIPPKQLFFRHKVTKNASTMEFEQFCILGKKIVNLGTNNIIVNSTNQPLRDFISDSLLLS